LLPKSRNGNELTSLASPFPELELASQLVFVLHCLLFSKLLTHGQIDALIRYALRGLVPIPSKQQQIPYGEIKSIQVNTSCCASCSSVSISSGADGSVLQLVGIAEDHEFEAVVQDHMKNAVAGCCSDEPNDDDKTMLQWLFKKKKKKQKYGGLLLLNSLHPLLVDILKGVAQQEGVFGYLSFILSGSS
jgi:hypothetical protein